MLFFILASCKPIQYKQSTDTSLPELGVVGIYTNFLLGNDYQPKTIISLSGPVRLQWKETRIQKRKFFVEKDSLSPLQKDSTLISFEILDKVGLLTQVNADTDLIKYLRKNERYKLVSEVTVHFPSNIQKEIKASDEIYLIQNKSKTLSLSLLKENKIFSRVEFNEGKIIKFKISEFCWGLNKRRETEIFDLVPEGTECSGDTYKTAKKAEKKNEFKF